MDGNNLFGGFFMYIIGKIRVTSVIPDKLARLKDIAYNLWWSWNSEAIDLFREIDPLLWDNLESNPVRFLQEVSQLKLEEKINDENYMQKYRNIVERFDSYMSETDTWFSRNHPDKKDHMVAYFSAEYGINEVLPIYSGGLGILSGDHCKSASDLGIPFTAIGLFYKSGYFSQRINREGWQETAYTELNPHHLPITPVMDENGKQVYISIEFPGRIVHARIWQVKVGRISIYLMDTDFELNNPEDRALTSTLYGGDQETRIQQEILLGIGGIRVLDALNIKATVYHMNEGHSAFMGLELIRKLMQEKGLSFGAAKEAVASCATFTTHTPVPAGNDVFPLYLIDKYFGNFWGALGISRHEFLDLGLKVNDSQNFNMTVLALSLAGHKNGVSALHGAVTRRMFNNMWPGVPEDEVPISHITNGIHTLTWLSPDFKNIYDKYLAEDWQEKLYDKDFWNAIDNIPDEVIWKTHCALKEKMINIIRDRIREQRKTNGEAPEYVREAENLLDPNALTIGFARRFATYKRASLIFRNIDRIRNILNNPDMPVQIIFAGKAHPADRPAHEVIKHINDIARQEGFNGKVVLIENYNMTLARALVQGVDVWLNNPRRPLEASGTSGQKVSINGIINFSVIDGWWCEGYNGRNGWAIGSNEYYENEYYQDNADSESLYETLEQQIIPTFYSRNENGLPVQWIKIMKESIKSILPVYNTHRMVQEYVNDMYIPSMLRADKIIASNYDYVRNLSDWKSYIEKTWSQVQILPEGEGNRPQELNTTSGSPVTITTSVNLGEINPSDVKVELYYGNLNPEGKLENPEVMEMKLSEKIDTCVYKYSAEIKLLEGGEYGYTFRVIPYHQDLINKFDTRLIKWAVQ